MRKYYKLLSVFLIMALTMSFSSFSYAGETDKEAAPTIKIEGTTLYTYGVPVLIKKDDNGKTNIYRDDTSQELLKENVGPLTIYGGGKNESITGDVNITVDGVSYSKIYGGGYSDGLGAADVQGNVRITVKGEKNANTIYGGGYATAVHGDASANVSGSVSVNIPAKPASDSVVFYGAGHAYAPKEHSAAADVGKVTLYVTGRIYNVTGGGYAGANNTGTASAKVKSSVSIHLKEVDARDIYSGGQANGKNAIADVGSVESRIDGTEVASLYGGGWASGGGQANVIGDVKLYLKDCSNLYAYIYGGGWASSKASAATAGSTDIEIENCISPVYEQFENYPVAGAIINGGSASGEGANANVGGQVQLTIKGGSGGGNIYGGGEASSGGSAVTGDSEINIEDVKGYKYEDKMYYHAIFAAGERDSGEVSLANAANCKVTVNRSTLEDVWGGVIVDGNPQSIEGTSDLILNQSQVTSTITCFDTITLDQPQHLKAFLYKGENQPTQLIAEGFSVGDELITCDNTESAADWFSLKDGALDYEVTKEASIWRVGNLTSKITASSGEHGNISPSGEYLVNQGEDAVFTITPDSGYRISKVEVDGQVVDTADGIYKFTDVREDHTIYVEFKKAAVPDVTPPYIPPTPPAPDVDKPTPADVTMDNSKEVIDSLLGAEDMEDIKNGSEVSFKLEAETLGEKNLNAEIAEALDKHIQTSGQKVAANLDINLIKVKDKVETKVTSTAKKVRITVKIPEEFLDETGLRHYSLLRLHAMQNGTIKTDELPDLDKDPTTVTVETDLFSVYSLIYKDEDPAKNARIVKGVKATTLKLSSSRRYGSITINWTRSKGYKIDGYEVFRSTKKNTGYGTKAFAKTTKQSYKNTKKLKKGTRYYYKVRGYRTIGSKKVYTKWSNKAFRVAI